MTTEEFSNEFDVLINSYANGGAFGEGFDKTNLVFDEYEKSVFLTKAQEDVIISYYNGTNAKQEGFENTEEIRRYLNSLSIHINYDCSDGIQSEAVISSGEFIDSEEQCFDYVLSAPENLWFITTEFLKPETVDCHNGKRVEIIPTTKDEVLRILENPFRGVTNRRALRLDVNNNIEIISPYKNYYYYCYYLAKPAPIILTDLSDLTINNISTKTECSVHEALHRPILQRAVQLAIASKVGYRTQQQ